MFDTFGYFKKRKEADSRGFLMMYAILFITVVLSISIEILSISLKQFSISSTGEESARALYAADAGMECAFYLDIYKGYFSTSAPTKTYQHICDTNDITIQPPANPYISPLLWYNSTSPSFQVKFGSGKDLMCANVYVSKTLYTTGTLGIKTTTVTAKGYNTDCPGVTPLRLPLVERRLKSIY